MERAELIDMLATLQLAGMRTHLDDILARGCKRSYSIEQVLGELFKAEIAEKQARSIRYHLGVAKLPLAKELGDFVFADTPINEALVRDLATGSFLAQQRNVVLIGRDRHWQKQSGPCHRSHLHPQGIQGPLLQRRGSRQPARGRGPRWPTRAPRRRARPSGCRGP